MPPNTVTSLSSDNEQLKSVEMTEKKSTKFYQFETELIVQNAIFLCGLHLIGLYYLFTFPYLEYPVLTIWIYIVYHVAGMGVTAGAHRLWSHRSYKATTPLRIFLAMCYYSAGMNKIFRWTRDHRLHHKYTDTEIDPHDTNRGFWFSHVGWLMLKKKKVLIERGRGIDMSDIVNDPVIKFFDGNFVILNTFFTFILPVFIPVYFFNQPLKWAFISQVFIRYPLILNSTWAVNSFAHMYGYHTYDKSIRPTENIWVGIAAGGEGWHNYHHVFPWDYKASELRNFLLNPTTHWINLFAKMGLAYDLKSATDDHIRRVVERKGDGTHEIYPLIEAN